MAQQIKESAKSRVVENESHQKSFISERKTSARGVDSRKFIGERGKLQLARGFRNYGIS